MRVDFKNAAKRHFDDARWLEQYNRLANADHLYGLAAECMLKAMIARLDPGAIDSNTGDFKGRSPHKKHLNHSTQNNDLWAYFINHFSARIQVHLPPVSPFPTWKIEQRYLAEGCFSSERVSQHYQAATDLKHALDGLFMSGVGNG